MSDETRKRSDLIVKALSRFIKHGAVYNILNLIKKSHPADIAKAFSFCSEEERQFLWSVIPNAKLKAEMLAECEPKVAKTFLEEFPEQDVINLLEHLDPDDQVYMANLLPLSVQERLYERMERKSPETTQIAYAEEQTAGSIMTTQYIDVQDSVTVGEALNAMRSFKESKDVFYLYLYVVNNIKKLVGVVSLRELLQHKNESDFIREVMHKEVYTAQSSMDQEEAAQLVETYNLLALPVVNEAQEMVGVITVDDIIDVISEEAEEDMLKISGVGADTHISQETVLRSVHKRFPWLFAASLAGMLCMLVIRHFESALSNWWYLAIFIPAINGISGNVGVQTSVIIIRGITTDTIDQSRLALFILRQVTVGAVLGLIFGCMISVITYLFFQSPAILPIVVGSALTLSIICSTCIGIALPFVFHRIGADPTLAASPLVLSLVDITAVSLFFFVASWLLTSHG